MNAKEIRAHFLKFFEQKGHSIVPSAPMVVKNDPTLMFTNAGMNQFKDFFLGNAVPDARRVADTQKCLRVSGKHNDLEEVGLDTYHHTMFEMLGNWSFGDYFKEEAIAWAWELLTEVYELPKERLYVTVFEGNKEDNLPVDSEAAGFWEKYIEKDRILYASKKDNFWEMGDTGPCGPCSEIHIDLRPTAALAKQPGKELVNADHPQVVEIWNLVFMQFNRKADGSLIKLPETHVDTGMGFERLAMAIQGKLSNYDTDVFQPLIQALAKKAGVTYGDNEKTDIAIRVISDHIRAIAFAITDGQLPSNNKAGYVIRRILRRAVRYGYNFLNFKEPFMYELVPVLGEQFSDVFPEMHEEAAFIQRVIQQEEAAFLKTLEKGLGILQNIMEKQTEGKIIKGEVAFELNDTYGFPFDLTALIARENGFEADEDGFKKAMMVQKERSRAAAVTEQGDWTYANNDEETEFIGYDYLKASVKIVRYREVKDKKKTFYHLVLDKTPFYAESGGQTGDKGVLKNGTETIKVIDTKKENDLIVHFVDKLPNNPKATFEALVSTEKRLLTTNNHSATHLLHAALKEVLGEHVAQKGSLVNEKILRFDFSHFAKMTEEEIAEVERIVNQRIRENIQLDEKRNVPIDDAKAMGATALFGEKYGDFVRVITFNPQYSVELCGGTHVPATGQIGFFKITSESSISAGVRRVEGITSAPAEEFLNAQLGILNEVKEMLKNPKDLKKSVESLLAEKNALLKEIEQLRNKELQGLKSVLLEKVSEKDGINVIIEQVNVPNADGLKQLSFELKEKLENLFMVLAADIAGKPQISVVISEELVKIKNLHAGTIIRELAKEIDGGGGGQPFFATAGGKDLLGLGNVIEKAKTLI